ncbi:PRKR-interacting protein 1 homolog [Microcaecilia unicolor]|uniref:PRKR-interacting protein 1 homolog n=1 Tax=Microcaecilia unicolor TaxID=1415580 RepID=A0A6P7YRS9_9AMPH|nr:PRKR-interacting protein 1 homolog [Microcaecilia unicolor]
MSASKTLMCPKAPRAGKEPQPLVIPHNAVEEQRLKLERLMRNPERPAPIPERPGPAKSRAPPEFVRDVMGSSAGAGSGEFHVYRHLRRREYQRQQELEQRAVQQRQQGEEQQRTAERQRQAEERTARKRKKRQRRREALKKRRKPEGGGLAEEESGSDAEWEDDSETPGTGGTVCKEQTIQQLNNSE